MTIKETNLTPYEGTIKVGQRLIKVGDMWMPVGVGGEGIDTSDATATEEDILKGYTAYVKGEKIRGTHECESWDISTGTATASDILEGKTAFAGKGLITGTIRVKDDIVISLEPGQDVILPSGYYNDTLVEVQKLYIDGTDIRYGVSNDGLAHSGSFTGDATATAADILKGKTAGIMGEMVTGTLVPPSYYKCASVDTTAKTWSGYKTVLTDGVYSLEETATEGLTFGAGFTPQVGTIYSADTMIRVDKMFGGASAVPDNGLIFYLPFNGNAEPVEGEITSTTGELTYGEVNGIKYAQFSKSQYFEGCKATQDTVDAFTVACTVRVHADGATYYYPSIVANIIPPDSGYIANVNVYRYNDVSARILVTSAALNDAYADLDTFISNILTCDADGNVCLYVNGAMVSTSLRDRWKDGFNVSNMIIGRGRESTRTEYLTDTDVADVAVWNRVLTAEEIAQVAARAASMN